MSEAHDENQDRQQLSPEPDTRFCYGANCSWFGPIQDVGSTGKYHVKDKAEHFPAPLGDHSLPCCPCCGGMLFEVPNADTFWGAIKVFEIGNYKMPPDDRPGKAHPGYTAMWEWQRDQKTCFPNADALRDAYQQATGILVDLAP